MKILVLFFDRTESFLCSVGIGQLMLELSAKNPRGLCGYFMAVVISFFPFIICSFNHTYEDLASDDSPLLYLL